MSFLHSEQPKCNKIPLSSVPDCESEDPKCSFFYSPIKREISPFPPGSGILPFHCCALEKPSWPGLTALYRPRPRAAC